MPIEAETSIVWPSIVNGRSQRGEDLLGHERGVGRVPRLGQEDRELVAPEARDRVHRAEQSPQPLRELLQQKVAELVAEGVVDLLEPVEVHGEERERRIAPPDAADRVIEAVAQQHAIREAR